MTQLIIIGGSAGSLEVLLRMLPLLKNDFTIPVILVLHRKQSNDSMLTDLLSTKTNLVVKEVEEKDKPAPGTIYVVPGDYHLLMEKDHTYALDYSERVNYSRPSIDVVFESAAEVYKDALVCVLLSGGNADGAKGLGTVQEMGGTTVAQRPDTAEVAYMPEQAIQRNVVDHILDINGIVNFLNGLNS